MFTPTFKEKVGSGGLGDVYKETYAGKTVALKVIKPTRINETLTLNAFKKEIEITAKLPKHENLIEYIGVLKDQLGLIIAFESGETLTDLLIRVSQHPAEFYFQISQQLVSAVRAVHAIGVIHRDISVNNIMVQSESSQKWRIKLFDFGLAISMTDQHVNLAGTIGYVAPEALLHDQYFAASDVFSIAMCFWSMIYVLVPYPPHLADGKLSNQQLFDELINLTEKENYRSTFDNVRQFDYAPFLLLIFSMWLTNVNQRLTLEKAQDQLAKIEKLYPTIANRTSLVEAVKHANIYSSPSEFLCYVLQEKSSLLKLLLKEKDFPIEWFLQESVFQGKKQLPLLLMLRCLSQFEIRDIFELMPFKENIFKVNDEVACYGLIYEIISLGLQYVLRDVMRLKIFNQDAFASGLIWLDHSMRKYPGFAWHQENKENYTYDPVMARRNECIRAFFNDKYVTFNQLTEMKTQCGHQNNLLDWNVDGLRHYSLWKAKVELNPVVAGKTIEEIKAIQSTAKV